MINGKSFHDTDNAIHRTSRSKPDARVHCRMTLREGDHVGVLDTVANDSSFTFF